jgi:hypothetical protein
MVCTNVINLVTRTSQEAIVTEEPIVTVALGCETGIIKQARAMIRACTEIAGSTRARDRTILTQIATLTLACWLECLVHCTFATTMAQFGVFGRARAEKVAFLAQEALMAHTARLLVLVEGAVTLIVAHLDHPIRLYLESWARLRT